MDVGDDSDGSRDDDGDDTREFSSLIFFRLIL